MPGHTHAQCKALILREYRGFCVHGAFSTTVYSLTWFCSVSAMCTALPLCQNPLACVASATLNSASRLFMLFGNAQYVISLPFCWFGLGLRTLRNKERLNPAVYPPSASVSDYMFKCRNVLAALVRTLLCLQRMYGMAGPAVYSQATLLEVTVEVLAGKHTNSHRCALAQLSRVRICSALFMAEIFVRWQFQINSEGFPGLAHWCLEDVLLMRVGGELKGST